MTKRFNIEKGYRGEGKDGTMIYDNDGVDDYYLIHDKEELQKFVELVNGVDNDFKTLKQLIIDMYQRERTDIGKSVLKQVIEAMP